MLAKTLGAAIYGVNAALTNIEVSINQGVGVSVVGLPVNAVEESLSRIDAALKNSGYKRSHQKTVISLAPADVRKEGAVYDLPISLCLLAASGKVDFKKDLGDYVILGELALNGSLRPIKGALPVAIEARKQRYKGFILPTENALEASIVNNLDIIGVNTLQETVEFLEEKQSVEPVITDTRDLFYSTINEYEADFAHVQGQENIKRSLEIAAAGGHSVILIGPPGAGQTMLAKRLPSILPPLTLSEALETTKIHSVAGKLGINSTLISRHPYRNPHHSISKAALVGGGSIPQPGEISLAHNGVLFLDELPEFEPSVLEALRQPLEDRKVIISNASQTIEYPANFMLIASVYPCQCGYYNNPTKECNCPPEAVQRYLNRIPSSLLDRIDLHIKLIPVDFEQNSSSRKAESSAEIRERVVKARDIQAKRFANTEMIYTNAMMPAEMVLEVCIISEAGKTLLKRAMERLGLLARAHDRILKVARTIADLADSNDIQIGHLAEAIQYRSLDQ